MKAILVSSLALAMLAGAAQAQAPAAGPQAPAAGPQAPAAGPQAPAAGPQAPAAGPQAPAAGPNVAPPPPTRAPLPKGAHIILQDGDAIVDIKCSDDEPMRVCADITLQILEKLVSLPKK